MNTYESFDTTPTNEDCVSVSQTEEYTLRMSAETKRMIALLEKKFPDVEGFFDSKWCNHDFGRYQEIRYWFDDSESGWNSYEFVENNWPKTWEDDEPIYSTVPNEFFEINEHGVKVFRKNVFVQLTQDLRLNGLGDGEVILSGTNLEVAAGMPYGLESSEHHDRNEIYCYHPNDKRISFWVARCMVKFV